MFATCRDASGSGMLLCPSVWSGEVRASVLRGGDVQLAKLLRTCCEDLANTLRERVASMLSEHSINQ